MSNDEPVGFTNLVTYAWQSRDGSWKFDDIIVDDPIELLTDNAQEPCKIINVLQITKKQAAELEQ